MEKKTLLYLALTFTILIWGNSFVLVKVAIDDGASPIMIAMARFLIASTVFGVFLIVRRPRLPDRSDLPSFIFLAFIGVGIYYIFQYYGVEFAGPSISAILVTLLCPVIVFLLSRYRLGERMSAQQKSGLLVSVVGSYLVITDGSLRFVSNGTVILGGIFGVVCAVFWAWYTIEGKRLMRKYDPISSTAYITLLGTAMLAPIALADYGLNSSTMAFPPSLLMAAAYLGILCSAGGYVLWFKALTGLTASATGATLYFEPVVTVVFAYIILGNVIGWFAAIGGFLVLIGVAWISRG
jgi:drug/metabolite transporter (DMT)-like permease